MGCSLVGCQLISDASRRGQHPRGMSVVHSCRMRPRPRFAVAMVLAAIGCPAKDEKPAPAPILPNETRPTLAVLEGVIGTVEIRRAGKTAFETAVEGIPVKREDWVRTGEASAVQLKF